MISIQKIIKVTNLTAPLQETMIGETIISGPNPKALSWRGLKGLVIIAILGSIAVWIITFPDTIARRTKWIGNLAYLNFKKEY